MSKGMYSLILIDDLVRRVDRIASEQGVSRSVMMNRILAEYLSVQTPEKRAEEVFRRIVGVAGAGPLQISLPGAGCMLQARRVLHYKYNPTIRYSIELSPGEESRIGSLRAVSRTQSPALTAELGDFFRLWSKMELYCMQQRGLPTPQDEIGSGRYYRELSIRKGEPQCEAEQLGQVIGDYIQMLDAALNRYLSQGRESALQGITDAYLRHLKYTPIIL